ncbi:MAG: isochorismate synthase MenF [Burkholderiales bacterium]
MDDVVTTTIALERGLSPASVHASFDCADLFALPARLGAAPAFLPQLAWSDSAQGGECWLALGEIDSLVAPAGAGFAAALATLSRARERLKLFAGLSNRPGRVRYVGGLAFDPRQVAHPGWPGGEAARFILPRVIVRQARGRAEATVLGTPEPEARRLVERLRRAAREDAAPATPIRMTESLRPGAREQWTGAVREALGEIDAGKVRKVVLSRDIVLDAARPIDPWGLIRLVHERDPHGLRFCLRFDARAAFVGASPERLVVQDGGTIACDCLAGTIARGATPEAEARNGATLLASEKDGREHRIVLEEILAALAPHVGAMDSPPSPRLLPLAEVQHLWSPIRAELRPGTGLAELVGALHPTPAVGGSPRLRAMDLIRALEQRPRGWYAGLVGWIGQDAADFAVAIRSGIVRGNRLTAFGGAGIVRGSDPLQEWDETARKAASFLHLFAERA